MPSQRPVARFAREKWPLLIALWVAISSNIAILAVLWPRSLDVDFRVFWRAARAVHPYAPAAQPFAYPPTALLWFSPLRLLDLWPAYLAWTALSLLLFALAAWRLYGRGPTALAMISPAIPVAVIPGQTSLLASALLFAAFAWDRPYLRGLLLGALLTLKPQLAIMAPLFLLVRRDWVGFGAMVVATILLASITTVLFGPAIWSEWLGAVPAFRQVVAQSGLSMSAVSPATFAATLGIPSTPVLVAGSCIAIAMALLSGGLDDPDRAAMIAAASLFAAPYALRYDMVAIAPAMAAIILARKDRAALLACVAYSATFGPLSLAASAWVARWRREPVKSS